MKKKITPRAFPALMSVGFQLGVNQVLSFVNSKGEIHLDTNKKRRNIYIGIAFLRGVVEFFYGLFLFFHFLFESIKFSEAEMNELKLEKQISNKLNISKTSVFWSIMIFFSVFFGFFVLAIAPDLIASTLKNSTPVVLRNLFVGTIKSILFISLVFCLRFIPSMRTFFRYNGAINVCINLFKDKKTFTITKAKEISKYISTNFLAFIFFTFSLNFFVVSLIVLNTHPFVEIIYNCLLLIASASVSYEILKLFENNWWGSRVFACVVCFAVTSKPTHTELEIALCGLEELNQMANSIQRQTIDGDNSTFATSSIICEVKNALAKEGIDDPSEAEWLVATVLGKNRVELKLIHEISLNELEQIRIALSKRIMHMPLSKIFGWSDFYGYKMIVDKNVLSPRPETELVCEEAIKLINKHNLSSCLDLCTGSGAIAIVISKNTNIKTSASDISKSALKIAQKNAQNNDAKIKFFESNMLSGLKNDTKFDIIISNPPYIPSREIPLLEEEVKNFDPHIALDGGEDGLMFYKKIASDAPLYLKKDGYLVLEVGSEQGLSVKKLLSDNFENIILKKDYNGNDRIIIAKIKGVNRDRKNTKNS